MSIYATLWEILVPPSDNSNGEWACVYAQAVPAHVGHPSQYPDGDPYAAFLPDVVDDYDPETGKAPYYRAVVIVQHWRNKKKGQQYVDPLLVLSGKEYAQIPFPDLLDRIHKAITWEKGVMGWFDFDADVETRSLRSDEEEIPF